MRLPDKYKEYQGENVMSNFDHEIMIEIVKVIKGKNLFSRYSGANFHGLVWWDIDSKKWFCDVCCYHRYEKTFEADTLEEMMKDICCEYGDD